MEIKHWNGKVLYKSDKTTLREALIEAIETRANLEGANLTRANLEGANLYGANLTRANLEGSKGLERFRICADGTIVGWKKIRGGLILRLEIPADAARLNCPSSRKCRAEYAIVCGVYDAYGKLLDTPSEPLTSTHDEKFTYVVGREVRPNRFESDIRLECAPGIHFFITFEEARDY